MNNTTAIVNVCTVDCRGPKTYLQKYPSIKEAPSEESAFNLEAGFLNGSPGGYGRQPML